MHVERTSAPPGMLVGRVVAGRYRLDAVLGSGASGVVYRARHLDLGCDVALKVPSAALGADPRARALFRREARAGARFRHPSSVRMLDFGAEPDGLPFLVMELVEGRELLAALQEDGPMAPARIVHLLGQVLDALAAAHDAGIVHRDVKPENVLVVDRDGEEFVKVTDFGIAKPFGGSFRESMALTAAGMMNGTPTYIAPEQIMGEELDGRADLYAVGVVLYELLCGAPPFEDPRPFDLILAHLMRTPAPPSQRRPEVHRGLEGVALRALSKKREDRHADARAMKAALLEALADDDDEVRDTRPSPVPPREIGAARCAPPRAARRAAMGVIVAAIGAAIAVAGATAAGARADARTAVVAR